MTYKIAGPKRQCPECAWDATGAPPPDYPGARVGELPPADEPLPYEFECGNCGFQWTLTTTAIR